MVYRFELKSSSLAVHTNNRGRAAPPAEGPADLLQKEGFEPSAKGDYDGVITMYKLVLVNEPSDATSL